MRLFALILIMMVLSHEAHAHGWYSDTSDPLTGFNCCGGLECAPIPAADVRPGRGGYIYLPTGEFIPYLRTQHSPDWQYHRCIYHSDFTNLDQGSFRQGQTRCFFAPQPGM